ncbi:MAG: ABC transporter ATP-binding protein [Dehalococcoidia bacterium]
MTTDFYGDESAIGKVYDRRILGRLWRYLHPYQLQVWTSVVLILAISALDAAGPLLVRAAIDTQIAVGRTDRLATLTLLFVGTLVAGFLLSYLQGMLMAYVGQHVVLDLRIELFGHLQRMAIAFFDRNPIGRLVTRVTNDVNVIEQVLTQGLVQIFTNLFMVVLFLGVLLFLDWRLAVAMYASMPLLVWAVRTFAMTQREAYSDQRVWLARINAYLNELITGVTVLQLFNRRGESMRRFDERNTGLLAANMRSIFWYAVFEPTVVVFSAVTTGAILWYGGGRVVQGALTLGTLVAFIQYMQRFYWPLRDLSQRYTTLQSAIASAERIFAVLDEPEEVRDIEAPQRIERPRGEIEFRNVWFAYGEAPEDARHLDGSERWVLRGVSFTIQPGEKVAIVGATGAGKSTMMSLLTRFYDVQRGAILVDGVPITQLPQRELRRHVGLMLQDPFIYTDSVLENVRLRDHSITEERVIEAARAVGAASFIERLPEGYATMLAERGANLSTGQKQLDRPRTRRGVRPRDRAGDGRGDGEHRPGDGGGDPVRHRAGDDEPHLDHHRPPPEHDPRREPHPRPGHRGQLVEDGTHEELLARGGYYHRLYELQYRAQAVDAARS